MRTTLRRVRNLASRLRHRLPPSRAMVSPAVDNDLFQAHLAVYRFAAGFAADKRCLDFGCGTGYGAAELAAAGAAEVVGVDADARAVAYARRRFASPGVRFERLTGDDLGATLGRFELAVAANVLAHLEQPAPAVERLAARLDPGGLFIASLPPILDGQTMDLHRGRTLHRSNLYLWDWEDLLRASFPELRLFRQVPPEGRVPDFGHPGPPRLLAADFRCEEVPGADLYDVGSLAALFVCTKPAAL